MSVPLANLTPAQLAMIPAGSPPPGVTPNLINPSSDGYILLTVGSVMMGIMLIFAGLRFYTKIFIVKKLTLDDCMFYLLLLSL
jgi:hypothetical protein